MKIPIISKLKQSRASPKNSLWGNTYSFFFGSTTSGKTVNERTAMQTTAVYACVRILAETILLFHCILINTLKQVKKKPQNINYIIFLLMNQIQR